MVRVIVIDVIVIYIASDIDVESITSLYQSQTSIFITPRAPLHKPYCDSVIRNKFQQ